MRAAIGFILGLGLALVSCDAPTVWCIAGTTDCVCDAGECASPGDFCMGDRCVAAVPVGP